MSYLNSVIKQLQYYKSIAEKTFQQLSIEELHKELIKDSNSVVIIAKHMAGNMFSRWTNFLTEDGEKSWRNRDDEFVDTLKSRDELLDHWNKGWSCFFDAIESLNEDDLERIVYIRNHGHTVTEAINRQLMHYAYHIGQIVFLGKLIKGKDWQPLSIPKGQSKTYNKTKFIKEKSRTHFTDDL